MDYRGYTAQVAFDDEEQILRGRIAHIRDVITFEAASVPELRKAFEEAVDDYVDFCTDRGEQPERPFSGRFLVRIEPDLHRQVAIAAGKASKSINAWVTDAIQSALEAAPKPRQDLALASAPAIQTWFHLIATRMRRELEPEPESQEPEPWLTPDQSGRLYVFRTRQRPKVSGVEHGAPWLLTTKEPNVVR